MIYESDYSCQSLLVYIYKVYIINILRPILYRYPARITGAIGVHIN